MSEYYNFGVILSDDVDYFEFIKPITVIPT